MNRSKANSTMNRSRSNWPIVIAYIVVGIIYNPNKGLIRPALRSKSTYNTPSSSCIRSNSNSNAIVANTHGSPSEVYRVVNRGKANTSTAPVGKLAASSMESSPYNIVGSIENNSRIGTPVERRTKPPTGQRSKSNIRMANYMGKSMRGDSNTNTGNIRSRPAPMIDPKPSRSIRYNRNRNDTSSPNIYSPRATGSNHGIRYSSRRPVVRKTTNYTRTTAPVESNLIWRVRSNYWKSLVAPNVPN